MGVAIAEAAARRGASVTLVAASVTVPTTPAIERIEVETAAQLADATRRAIRTCRCFADGCRRRRLSPRRARGKMSREGSGGIDLHLEETEDILASRGRAPGGRLVGFAAEHGPEAIAAPAKAQRKGVTRSSSTTSPVPRSDSTRLTTR